MEMEHVIGRIATAVTVGAMIVLSGPTPGAMAAPAAEGASAVAPKPPGGVVVVTVAGTVTEGVESGCKMLQKYVLLGADVSAGDRVRVTGQVVDVATTCQQGIPLQVTSVTFL